LDQQILLETRVGPFVIVEQISNGEAILRSPLAAIGSSQKNPGVDAAAHLNPAIDIRIVATDIVVIVGVAVRGVVGE